MAPENYVEVAAPRSPEERQAIMEARALQTAFWSAIGAGLSFVAVQAGYAVLKRQDVLSSIDWLVSAVVLFIAGVAGHATYKAGWNDSAYFP